MKLVKARVTNFRSVENSGDFEVDQLLALVGKNEAGKSAILQALNGLVPHPATPFQYDRERDYPRRFLTEYKARHQKEEATVVNTEWKLSSSERASLEEEFGEGVLLGEVVSATRRYEDEELQWNLKIGFTKNLDHLMKLLELTAAEREPLKKVSNSRQARELLEGMETRTEHQTLFMQRLQKLPGQSLTGAIVEKLNTYIPQFMYFSYYDRMVGQIRLDTFLARKSGQGQPIQQGEQVFLDFLEYAGTSIEEIVSANTYESLNARCEAASNRISEQLREYWTQNPFLEMEVRVTKAESGDPAPFNQGVIARARVKNNLHKLTLPFSERSAGFIWFFSFLVKFAQVNKEDRSLILLLDEPGLTLHGKAQGDLLRYFTEKLAPQHQVIYSTHSPFMVPADRLPLVRVVEDRVTSPRPGVWNSEGTKVRSDVLAVDRDTLFPLQGALGYEITQSLFIGKHTLLVEGPGDVLYIHSWSDALSKRGRTKLDGRWTICPAGGLDKIQPFIALFSSAKLEIGVLTDFAKSDKRKLENLRQSQILQGDRILTFASLLSVDEADAEDVFVPELYVKIVNQAFRLKSPNQLTTEAVANAEKKTSRLVKKVEAAFRLLSADSPEFDHYTPADWLIRNPALLDGESKEVEETLERAEKVVVAVNAILGA
jgi:predicted ATP-dependent endonuclease of OLD family